MNNLKKEYPIDGFEQDCIFSRSIYCYLRNNNKHVKFIKRKINKRFRKFNKKLSNFNESM